mmetsp:Transcript_38471/g.95216  ORF Transcript_38471/g.95216 Transcript_38471/m.95216 type:complete len:142 (-) Transcript_38471:315-740(-)
MPPLPRSAESFSSARARYIPLRLTPTERAKLGVLEAALVTSEYTDKVDVMDYRSSKQTRMHEQLNDLLNIVGGLCVAADMRDGRKLLTGERAPNDTAVHIAEPHRIDSVCVKRCYVSLSRMLTCTASGLRTTCWSARGVPP